MAPLLTLLLLFFFHTPTTSSSSSSPNTTTTTTTTTSSATTANLSSFASICERSLSSAASAVADLSSLLAYASANPALFYHECDIYGTIDFIFGNAAVLFQGCSIIARKPIPGQSSVVTTQSRDDPSEDTGISIQNCSIIASDDLRSSNVSTRTYLGRPWRPYSRTVNIESYIDSLVDPAGWTEWPGNHCQDTLYYREYMNSGPGSGVGARVTWHGYHVMGYNDATNFSVSNFIYGDEWLDSTSFPYDDDIPQLRYIIYTKKSAKTN
uniref:Pectinesterase n=1 Tax=Ananas comosus var. bracteatus TaxID=296719 RepID=A0A6V7P3V1_ANACO|nr:unnamed protein product [Ananas comosus var. bracteatus]